MPSQTLAHPHVRPLLQQEPFAPDLQAGLFILGTLSWLISEVVLHTHVPGWTALLGWSLLFSNIFALPLMNLGGLILEEAPARDFQGILGALVLSFALVPFQAWAAFKGLISKYEGPWFRTPKTGRVTDEVHHLRRLQLLRRWLLRRPADRRRPSSQTGSAISLAAPIRVARHRRKTGWVTAGGLLLVLGVLALGSIDAPVVESAGNPLYLHGTGAAPGCLPGSMSATAGARAPGCRFSDAVGVFSFANLPAQTVVPGVWSFTMYWAAVGPVHLSHITLSVGLAIGPTCAGAVWVIPRAGTTWTTTYGAAGINKVSPFTVNTSGPQLQLVIPAGRTLCLRTDISQEEDDEPMVYDGPSSGPNAAGTRLTPPSTVVPESLLGLLGVALAIPLITGRRRVLSFLRTKR